LLLLLLFCPLLTFAVKGYRTGDELHVLAISGIKLRGTPGGDKILATIPYASKLIVAEVPSPAQPFEADGISGFWVKVKFKEQIGFVFDGFLSWLPAPDKSCTDLAAYAKKYFKPQGPEFVGHAFGCLESDVDAVGGYELMRLYQWGQSSVLLTDASYYEGVTQRLSCSGGRGFSLEEGWLLAKAVYRADIDRCLEMLREHPGMLDLNDNPISPDPYQRFAPNVNEYFIQLYMMPEGCSDVLSIGFDPATQTIFISRSVGC
jgi:hypothetical protein